MSIEYEPIKIIDSNDPNDIFVGSSVNGNDRNKPFWRIKRIININGIWYTQFPDGIQDYSYVWDNRLSYTYK